MQPSLSSCKWSNMITRFLGIILLSCVFSNTVRSADLVRFTLSDLRILYLFDEPEQIDWPTLYYLNDRYGCRVDLISLTLSERYQSRQSEIAKVQFFLHRVALSDSVPAHMDSLGQELFADRRADVVIFADDGHDPLYQRFRSYILGLGHDSSAQFQIERVYKRADGLSELSAFGAVSLNTRELLQTYRPQMESEIPEVFPWFHSDLVMTEGLVCYLLLQSQSSPKGQIADFVTELPANRLAALFERLVDKGALQEALIRRATAARNHFDEAIRSAGRARVEQILAGHKELLTLREQTRAERRLSGNRQFSLYLADLIARSQAAMLDAVGLSWNGQIIMRDSPDGPKVKFRALLSADGPQEIQLSSVQFLPYWDTLHVKLDSLPKIIAPHQNFVREYLVDLDRTRLEAEQAESLQFACDLAYNEIPFTVHSAVPIWETPNLSITFQPGFYFLPQPTQLDVDKVVASMTWRAMISKPTYYSGKVDIQLETPRGVFAGAYQTQLTLKKGSRSEVLRIPFSVSNLFELGIQQQAITLSLRGRPIATDTGIIRIASCHVDDTIKIGFLPDSTGLLEDVLRMTGAGFQPLTDRSLATAELEIYNVIVVGSGAFRDYPNLRKITGRLEEYIRYGGSLILLGQPPDWPDGVLPVNVVPSLELVSGTAVTTLVSGDDLLTKPYLISENGLLDFFKTRTAVTPAVVTPAEKVMSTRSGGALLSVSRLGKGKIIYCGLPITDMIAALNIDAIHLFANLLNH